MQFTVIILAAGQGKRLKSALPKPLHPIAGQPLISWVIDAAHQAGATNKLIVTAANHDGFLPYLPEDGKIIVQDPPQGTGHAVACSIKVLAEYSFDHPVVILFADTPLIQSETITHLVKKIQAGMDICCLGFQTEQPKGYGRMLVKDGQLHAIIEDRDTTAEQANITLVNGGVMAAKAGILCQWLPKLENTNTQKEYYLTDLVKLANQAELAVGHLCVDEKEVVGVNDRVQLAELEAVIQNRLRHAAMLAGVSLIAPETVYLSADTIFGTDITIEPNVVIGPGCEIGQGSVIKSFSHLEGAKVGNSCIIGPFARLRPGTILDRGVKIGNFVETKNAHLEEGAKANHLSYIGDAEVGAYANIGAGTITCNYDGVNKFKTEIGAYAFIGSNSALVAPVKIGDAALIGAGSVITQNVDSHALSLTRASQETQQDGAKKFRARAENIKKNRKK